MAIYRSVSEGISSAISNGVAMATATFDQAKEEGMDEQTRQKILAEEEAMYDKLRVRSCF